MTVERIPTQRVEAELPPVEPVFSEAERAEIDALCEQWMEQDA